MMINRPRRPLRPRDPCRGWACLVVGLLASVLGASGCGSSSSTPNPNQAAAAKAKAEAEKKQDAAAKKPFSISPVTPLLSEGIVQSRAGEPQRLAKPGHWAAAVQPMASNLADFEGRTTVVAVDDRGRALPVAHTPFDMSSSRPAVLAKGRVKRIETELFVPALPSGVEKLRVASEVVDSATGVTVSSEAPPQWSVMPSHQYFLLVLAREPARYAFLNVADSIRAPLENDLGESQPHYRVVLADAAKPLPLPPNVLTWTAVAYVVWDEVSPDRLDPAQQQALVDWLHWGGRLIVNGPDSLDSLRGSFLGGYLPVDPGETRTVSSEDVAPLHDAWTQGRAGKPLPPIAVTRPWSGVELKPRPKARELAGANGLFYEGPVGAGSIVVSAVQLAERDLVNWSTFDSFLNGGLLRRPGREFRVESDNVWVGLQTHWAGYDDRAHDAAFITPLRWFARDAGAKSNARQVAAAPPPGQPQLPIGTPAWQPLETRLVVDRPGGMGQWSAFGPVADAARDSLRTAAGVRVPGAGFVVACLALYLVVLVPLNWMTFHALGRVEWAWIAAPVIAVAGTILVVRQAQLDIGFVRSQTEIALLELYGGHPRGHLSRYTAMYSSLSTTYDMQYDDPTAVATPFPHDASDRWRDVSRRRVAFEKYDKPQLRGVTISSASTQFIHAEQMLPLAGPIRLTTPTGSTTLKQLENRSGFELSDAVVLRRRFGADDKPTVDGCWLGVVRDGASALLPWGVVSLEKGSLPYAAERANAAELDYRHRLDVDPLLKLAFTFPSADDPLQGRRDEYRLVARIDEPIPGSTASPRASQTTGATVVLVHLELELAPPPTPDVNSAKDVDPDRGRRAFDDIPLESPEN